ncbi:MAG: MATE family efflux transporter, partial [Clostridia bacterium]
MAKNLTRDMTNGSPPKLIFGFFFPLLFGLLFQQVYNMVDTIVVGRFLGVQALAGVGSTGSLNFLVLGFCVGICNGFVIPVAQKFGERDFRGLKLFAVNAIMLAVLCSIALMLIVCV